MGMAASQARLLSITARIHDVEFEAQSIQNAKLQLATQEDQVYKEYLDALDATTLTVKDWQGNRIEATFNSLCGINRVDSTNKYALKDSKGRLLVSDSVAKAYEEHGHAANAYMFALAVLGYSDDKTNLSDFLRTIYNNNESESSGPVKTLKNKIDLMQEILTNCGSSVTLIGADGKIPTDINFERLTNDAPLANDEENKKKFLDLCNQLYDIMYASYPEELLQQASGNTISKGQMDGKLSDFEYYVDIYNQIKAAGGYTRISDYNGPNGDAANDGEWLQNMIKCGKITVWTVGKNSDGDTQLNATAVSSDTYLEYTNTSSYDKTKLAKVEAEYEHKMKEIQKKDKKFDLNLSNLETERQALTKQYDSLTKVIQENVDRTFGIFGS